MPAASRPASSPAADPDLGGGSVAGKLKDLVSSRMKARLRCAAFRGNGFSLAKGNELFYGFVQTDAFDRQNRTQKAVNGLVRGVAVEPFGRASFSNGKMAARHGFEP